MKAQNPMVGKMNDTIVGGEIVVREIVQLGKPNEWDRNSILTTKLGR